MCKSNTINENSQIAQVTQFCFHLCVFASLR